ncbi:hypothetical protein AB0F72_08975 [Actinoplanes sp. NPDC023936]|uniref:hypothetical protein n=1 Tax=Actinoplanes sp. NPDC023936 TaxID=3154910 RepID=UPI0033C79234
MNPRTHPRGAPPDFTLPKRNPNPERMTDALWWLVCMREALEPSLSENGGTFARKPGSHNAGANLPDHGEGNIRTDHSIRHAWNRTGPWWKTKTAAHDWTFRDAQHGDYRTINKYTRRMIAAMADPDDLRPDEVIFYTLGNVDGDVTTEGYSELKNGAETSGDNTHAWHRHDSFFRRIIGDFWAMWKILTIDMGWTYAEWQQSIAPQQQEDDMPTAAELAKAIADVKVNVTPAAKTANMQPLGRVIGYGSWERHRIETLVKALATQVQSLGTALTSAIVAAGKGDDQALEQIRQQLAELPTATADAIVDHLGDADSPEQKAELLRAVLGDDAPEVGRLLASATS